MIALLFYAFVGLNQLLTPGALCSPADADFDHMAGSMAICRRHVPPRLRAAVFASHGVTKRARTIYELDHLIPLCAGGSNSPWNLWPEPRADAAVKDRREKQACARLRSGTITQAQAVAEFLR